MRISEKWESIIWEKQHELEKMIAYYDIILRVNWALVHLQEACMNIWDEYDIQKYWALTQMIRSFIDICIICGKKNKKYLKDRFVKKQKREE